MPWKVQRAVDQRGDLLAAYEAGESIAELSRIYGVSRQTIYKWIDRFQQQGSDGLQDRSWPLCIIRSSIPSKSAMR
jgi:transposase